MFEVITPPVDVPRAFPTDLARELLKETSARDRSIKVAIEDATASGEDLSPGRWVYREYAETVTASRRRLKLYLSARPIHSVSSVTLDDEDPLLADEFEVHDDDLFRVDGWPVGEWEVRYFGGFWLPASMGPARSSFAGTEKVPGTPMVDGVVAESATTMAIKGGSGMETIVPGDAFEAAGTPGSFRFLTGATASGGLIALQPDGFFEPAAPVGGFLDGAALVITHGVKSIDHEGRHLRAATWNALRSSWTSECDATGGYGKIIIPDPDAAVFRSEGPVPI